ncbi:MAG: acetyl-CoA carboxylase biotin carboxyl carrier protein [FCB group bacterium]|nr:acetyl-CoA carboxylase biotin carboxyl carrier protein [FCB group bacterium]
MKEKQIKKLIQLVEESDIDVLEVSSWGRKVRITRRLSNNTSDNGSSSMANLAAHMPPPVAVVAPAPQAPPAADDDKFMAIKSPMVGTFYAAPAPDAKPYVEVGQHVEKGQVVCIVEAMKLMNEIESEVAGRVTKVNVENAQPVEFGQAIFLIDPAG